VKRDYIGSSAIAAIVGMNPWSSPLKVWCEIMGIDGEEETAPQRRGKRIEPYIAAMYEEETKLRLVQWNQSQPMRHACKPYLGTTPDYTTMDGFLQFVVVECKSHRPQYARKAYGEPGTDQVPPHELMQDQWHIHILRSNGFDYDRCDTALLCGIDDEDFRIYRIEYDPEIGAMLEEAADRFWQDYVLTETPPPPQGRDSATLTRMYPDEDGTSIDADAETGAIIEELRGLVDERKVVSAGIDERKAKIKQAMQTNTYLVSALGRFSWKHSAKGRVSWEEVARGMATTRTEAKLLRLIEQHTSPGSRRFYCPYDWRDEAEEE